MFIITFFLISFFKKTLLLGETVCFHVILGFVGPQTDFKWVSDRVHLIYSLLCIALTLEPFVSLQKRSGRPCTAQLPNRQKACVQKGAQGPGLGPLQEVLHGRRTHHQRHAGVLPQSGHPSVRAVRHERELRASHHLQLQRLQAHQVRFLPFHTVGNDRHRTRGSLGTRAWEMWMTKGCFYPPAVAKRSQGARRSCTKSTRREIRRSASGVATSSWATSTSPRPRRRLWMQRAGCSRATWANTTRTDSSSSPEESKVLVL